MAKEVVWQNKDVTSKVMAEHFKEKSLKVYGIDVPRIVQVLPTNLPEISANELRIDNLFLLEDGTLAIIDYESEYAEGDKVKYLQYLARVLDRYQREGILKVRVRMIVIYTADVREEQVQTVYDVGAAKVEIQPAFLSRLDSKEISGRLKRKLEAGERLTGEELMEFIILPLTYAGTEAKKKAVMETIDLAQKIQEVDLQRFVLSGIVVFADKIIDSNTGEEVVKRIMMTKVEMILQEKMQEKLDKAYAERMKDVNEMMAEAEKQRAEAEKQKAEADQQKAEAEMQRVEAEKQRAEAEKQKAEAEKQKAEADKRMADAKREKDRSIMAFVQDKQEDGAPKETVMMKLMRYFGLSRNEAESYYERA